MGKYNATKINIHHNVVPKYANIYQKPPKHQDLMTIKT